ncbi:MAG: MG2 domain-containing protein [Sideroxyarcus sp.]|nr:MG2 domain-containing protein [Sideroxyarcus sp.]
MVLAARRVRFAVISFLAFLPLLSHAAQVDFFSPSGEVKKVRQVAVRFSEQMVAFGDPREVNPFDIACLAPGKGRWADQRNWIYDFEYDLPAGVACTFTIRKGLTALNGNAVTTTQTYSFNTGGPAVLQSEPYSGEWSTIDENQIFVLGLDAPATADSIQKNAHCQVDGIAEQVPVKLITGKLRTSILNWREAFLTRYYQFAFKLENGTRRSMIIGIDERGSDKEKFLKLRDSANSPIVVLQCARTFPNQAAIKIVWGKGVTSFSGIPTSQDQILAFRARPAFDVRFTCERVNADAGCIPALPMSMHFSSPVTVENAQKIMMIAPGMKPLRPVISENDKKSGFVQGLAFPTPLPEKTRFKIVLPGMFTDDAGRSLSNASSYPLEVRTDENPPLAKFAANFGILELNASPGTPPLLPLTLRNVETSLSSNIANPIIAGKTMHDDSELSVLGWMRKLQEADQYSYDEDDRGPGKVSVLEPGGDSKPFTIQKPLGDKAFEVIGIPLKEPGFYVVELASPRLGAALFGDNSVVEQASSLVKNMVGSGKLSTNRPYYVHAAALVTNLAVHFKQGRESSLVWVTTLDKGKPVVNAEVAVRNCSGKIYAQGKTDAQGRLLVSQELPDADSLPGCINGYDRQYFVTARLGKDFSFVLSGWNEGIALWRFNAFETRWSGHEIAHAVMDRTLLRAGETVHMKLIARRKTGFGFAKPEGALPVKIIIMHQGSEDRFEVPVEWDQRGTATLDWQIPQDGKQGTYVVTMPEAIGSFRVESFRVPTMKAVLQSADKVLVNADQAALSIQVNYLAGGGASFLPVKLRGQIAPRYVSFADYEDFTFANGGVKTGVQKNVREPWNYGGYEMGDPEEEGYAPAAPGSAENGNALATQELRLDAAGAARGVFANLRRSETPQEIHSELEYQDPNGQTLTATTRIPLWSSQTIVGIKPDGWLATAEHLKFHALVLGLDGKPKAGQQVVVRALQREYFSHRRRLIGGFYAFDNHSEIKAIGELCKGVTDNKGLLICDVKAPAKGNIILLAETKDAAGNTSLANRELYVAGNDDWWFDAADNDRIDLLPEKKQYEPGEKARFQLRMPFREADVLVTVEREGIQDSFVTHLTRANSTIEVPIKGHYSPNIFVSALAIRGRSGEVQPTALVDLGKPAFKMGLAEIRVGWAAHELKVKVATDQPTYHVRDKAKVTVDVTRKDGTLPPRDSEVVLVAVDEGLLELKPNESWKLLEAMMTRRGIEVSTSTAQMQVIGKRHFGRKALPAGGDGGGSRSARELFDTLLFWQARVKLDSNGHAEAIVPLNDSLTSFRIVAIANGDLDLFGTGSTSVASTQDLMLFSGLPPVVREQDRFHATFTVRNASDRAIEAVVNATQNGNALAPIEISLPAGESRNVGWGVNVPIDSEAIKWEIGLREKGASEDGDRLKTVQKVIAAVPVRTYQATIMQLDAPQSIAVKLPEGSIPGRGGVKVVFRKQLGDGLGGVQEYMSRYPYTCLEQQTSVAIALQDEERWASIMKRLPSHLDRDGLAKYWPIMYEGGDTLTAYLLSVASEAEYEIPEYLLNRMRKGLIGFVEGRIIRYSAISTSDLAVRKLAAIEALARTGEVERRWLDSITIEPNLWPTSAVLDWLSILQRKPEISSRATQQIEEAQQIIRSRLNFQGTTMGFSTERSDTLWWLMVSGDVNANRALLALYNDPKWEVDVPRLVRGALGRQLQGHWNTTVANAWGVLAMKRFSAKFESVAVTGATSAVLEKQSFIAEWNDDKRSAEQLLAWPSGTAPVKLSHGGNGKPWAMLQSLAALPLKEALSTGYRVTRQVLPISQKVKGEWHKGDVARVHLDVEAQSDMTWVVVNDPIPSGATILGTGLGGDSQLLTQGEKKQGWVWPAFEERTFDAFHAYYRFVPKGKFALEYTVRLNNDGAFNLPTTRVEAMYAPEMFGELPNAKVEVMP